MDHLLLHRCTVQTRDASENDFGEKTYSYTDTYTSVLCRLVSPSGAKQRLPAGEFVTGMPRLFLKADQDVSENCRIVGTTGFDDTYEILKVNEIHNSHGLHHKELDLRKAI